jgi:hypothetical protein
LCQSLPTDPSPKANIKIPVVINLNNIWSVGRDCHKLIPASPKSNIKIPVVINLNNIWSVIDDYRYLYIRFRWCWY